MQAPDEPRRRHAPRIRAEHARDVGPDFQPNCRQLGRKVTARGIATTTPEQHRVPILVAGNEALREINPARNGRKTRLHAGIGGEVAGR